MAVSLYIDQSYGASLTRFEGVTNLNFKSLDDVASGTAVTPISRGSNSYIKHISGRLLGSWTSLLAGYAYRDSSRSGELTNMLVFGGPTLGYSGSTTGQMGGGTLIAGTSAGTTQGVNPTLVLRFGNASAGLASFTSASNNIGVSVFTDFLRLQLVTTPSCSTGAIPSMTWVFAVNEA